MWADAHVTLFTKEVMMYDIVSDVLIVQSNLWGWSM